MFIVFSLFYSLNPLNIKKLSLKYFILYVKNIIIRIYNIVSTNILRRFCVVLVLFLLLKK